MAWKKEGGNNGEGFEIIVRSQYIPLHEVALSWKINSFSKALHLRKTKFTIHSKFITMKKEYILLVLFSFMLMQTKAQVFSKAFYDSSAGGGLSNGHGDSANA